MGSPIVGKATIDIGVQTPAVDASFTTQYDPAGACIGESSTTGIDLNATYSIEVDLDIDAEFDSLEPQDYSKPLYTYGPKPFYTHCYPFDIPGLAPSSTVIPVSTPLASISNTSVIANVSSTRSPLEQRFLKRFLNGTSPTLTSSAGTPWPSTSNLGGATVTGVVGPTNTTAVADGTLTPSSIPNPPFTTLISPSQYPSATPKLSGSLETSVTSPSGLSSIPDLLPTTPASTPSFGALTGQSTKLIGLATSGSGILETSNIQSETSISIFATTNIAEPTVTSTTSTGLSLGSAQLSSRTTASSLILSSGAVASSSTNSMLSLMEDSASSTGSTIAEITGTALQSLTSSSSPPSAALLSSSALTPLPNSMTTTNLASKTSDPTASNPGSPTSGTTKPITSISTAIGSIPLPSTTLSIMSSARISTMAIQLATESTEILSSTTTTPTSSATMPTETSASITTSSVPNSSIATPADLASPSIPTKPQSTKTLDLAATHTTVVEPVTIQKTSGSGAKGANGNAQGATVPSPNCPKKHPNSADT